MRLFSQYRNVSSSRMAIYLIMAASFMYADAKMEVGSQVRPWIETFSFPLVWLIDKPLDTYYHMSEYLESKGSILEKSQSLKEKQLQLSAKLQQYHSIQLENVRLRALLKTVAGKEEPMMMARLLHIQTIPASHQMIIDKGHKDGVYEGQQVIDARGVVGFVKHSGRFSSRVLLITDPNAGIPVESVRSGLRSIAFGTGQVNTLDLKDIAESADLKVGDILVTSGLGNSFAPGYPVGQIVSKRPTTQHGLVEYSVKPLASLQRSREVLLVGKKTLESPAPVVPASEEQPSKKE